MRGRKERQKDGIEKKEEGGISLDGYNKLNKILVFCLHNKNSDNIKPSYVSLSSQEIGHSSREVFLHVRGAAVILLPSFTPHALTPRYFRLQRN